MEIYLARPNLTAPPKRLVWIRHRYKFLALLSKVLVSPCDLFANTSCLRFYLRWHSFSHYPWFANTHEDRNEGCLKNGQLCGVWKLQICHHRAMNVTQICVCFANPCISLTLSPFITREFHCKMLEFFDLLQCITSVHLQLTQARFSWETWHLVVFSADFHSRLVARRQKPMFMLKTLSRRCKKY